MSMIRQLWSILLGDWSDQVIGSTVPWSERRRRQAEEATARYLLGRAGPTRWVKDEGAIAEREARPVYGNKTPLRRETISARNGQS